MFGFSRTDPSKALTMLPSRLELARENRDKDYNFRNFKRVLGLEKSNSKLVHSAAPIKITTFTKHVRGVSSEPICQPPLRLYVPPPQNTPGQNSRIELKGNSPPFGSATRITGPPSRGCGVGVLRGGICQVPLRRYVPPPQNAPGQNSRIELKGSSPPFKSATPITDPPPKGYGGGILREAILQVPLRRYVPPPQNIQAQNISVQNMAAVPSYVIPPSKPPPEAHFPDVGDSTPQYLRNDLKDLKRTVGLILLKEKGQPKTHSKQPIAKFESDLFEQRFDAMRHIQVALIKLDGSGWQDAKPTEFNKNHQELTSLAVDLAFPRWARQGVVGTETRMDLESSSDGLGNEVVEKSRHSFIKLLSNTRLQLTAGSQSRAKMTGAFLKAIADSTLVREAPLPSKQMEIATTLLKAISKGDSMMSLAVSSMNTNLPEIRTILSQLRANHYVDTAGLRFIANLGSEQADLVNYLRVLGRQSGGSSRNPIAALSFTQLRAAIPNGLRAKFDDCTNNAKAAAKARDDYEFEKERTVRVLGKMQAERAERALHISMAGIRVVDKSIDKHIRGDSAEAVAFIKELSKNNHKGAFQIARLALCMEKLAALENEVRGYNTFGMSDDQFFSAKAIMTITGVTRREVAELGYATEDVEGFHKNMALLGAAGLSSTAQTIDAMAKFHGASEKVLKDRGIQKNLRLELDKQTRTLATQIAKEVSLNALTTRNTLSQRKSYPDDLAAQRIQAFQDVNAAVHEALFLDGEKTSDLGEELNSLAGKISDAELSILEWKAKMSDVNGRIRESQALLASEAGHISGKRVANMEKKASLKCAKLIVKALGLQEAYEEFTKDIKRLKGSDSGENNADMLALTCKLQERALKDRDRALKSLDGVNTNSMQLPSWIRSFLNEGSVPSIHSIRSLSGAAEAVIFLRETAPKQLTQIQSKIDKIETSQLLDLDTRARAAPGLFNAVNRMIYTAIIEHMPMEAKPELEQGQLHPVYHMAGKRHAILATLTKWGLDTNAFAPEINLALARPVDNGVLRHIKEAVRKHSFADILGLGIPALSFAQDNSAFEKYSVTGAKMSHWWASKRHIDVNMRADFFALFDALKPGQTYDMKAGTAFELNTRKIPLEPTAIARLRARIELSWLKQLRVEVGDKGEYKIGGLSNFAKSFRGDIEIAARIESSEWLLDLGKWRTVAPTIRVGPKLAGKMLHNSGKGFEISFPAGEEGKTRAIEFLSALTENQRPGARIFEMAENVAAVQGSHKEGNISYEMMLRLGARSKGDAVSKNYTAASSGAVSEPGLGVSAYFGTKIAKIRKYEERENLNGKTVEFEAEKKLDLHVEFEGYTQFFSVLGFANAVAAKESGLQGQMDEWFNDGREGKWDGGSWTAFWHKTLKEKTLKSLETIHKVKLNYDKIGVNGQELLQNAEIKEIAGGAKRWDLVRAILEVLSDDHRAMLLKDGKVKLRDELRDLLENMARKGHDDVKLQVSYRLTQDKIELLNNMNYAAQEYRTSGLKLKAKQLELAAADFLNDRENYTVNSISLLEKSTSSSEATRGNAMLIRRQKVSQTQSERVLAEVRL